MTTKKMMKKKSGGLRRSVVVWSMVAIDSMALAVGLFMLSYDNRVFHTALIMLGVSLVCLIPGWLREARAKAKTRNELAEFYARPVKKATRIQPANLADDDEAGADDRSISCVDLWEGESGIGMLHGGDYGFEGDF